MWVSDSRVSVKFLMFDSILYVPVHDLSVMSDGSFLGRTSTSQS